MYAMHREAGLVGEEGARIEREPLPFADRLNSPWLLPAAMFLMTVAIFAKVMFSFEDLVLSSPGTDLGGEFVYWRKFGFDQLRAGHIALWNPHVSSGLPFMGGFQAALFYPPNLIYLILPLRTAINCEIALHVFLIGIFTMLWLKRYELHPLAVLLACTVAMFSGPFFFHVYPGHLATIDSLTWTPLILLNVEELVRKPNARWILVGILAISMQLLAGHPQTLFNTLVAAAIYGSLRLWQGSYRVQTIAAIAIVGVGALALTSVQIWAGLNASAEGTRQGGVPFGFAAMFSFPPENFLTLLVPGLFGNMTDFAYWGRCYLWEMSAFIGLTGLVMAIFGAGRKFPGRADCIIMIVAMAVLALANHTPLFAILYRFVPGFDHFRSHSKFLAQAMPFVAILIAQGTNRVLASPAGTRRAAILAAAAALIIGVSGTCLWYSQDLVMVKNIWGRIMAGVAGTGESYLGANRFASPDFAVTAAWFAGSQCVFSAVVLLAIALLLYGRKFHRGAAWALVIVGIGEMLWFANASTTSFSLASTVATSVRDFLDDHPGDYRILELGASNDAIAIGAYDIWSYDPMVLGRYAQFMTYSQGGDPDQADMYVDFRRQSSLLRLVRTKYFFRSRHPVAMANDALAHLLLLGEWAKQTDRHEILAALDSPDFNPERTAILESDPDPPPVSADGSPGSAEIVRSDTDSMTIAAHLTRPSLLMVTDCYSRYWRAVAGAGSAQKKYTVLPADYTLMAIPLAAGEHSFRLEYAPPGWLIGRWISLLSLIVYLFAVMLVLRRMRAQTEPLENQTRESAT